MIIRSSIAADVRNDTIMVRPTFDMVWDWSGTDHATIAAGIQAKVDAFLTTAATGGTHPLSYYHSAVLYNLGVTGYTVSLYDQTLALGPGGRAGPAFYTHHTLWPSGPSGSGVPPLPEQVSAVFSYRDDYGSAPEFGPPLPGTGNPTRPRAQLRGRFYYFPLTSNVAITADATDGHCIFAPGFITDAKASLHTFLTVTTVGGNALQPVIWSRKTGAINSVAWYDVNSRVDIRRHRAAKSPVHTWLAV